VTDRSLASIGEALLDAFVPPNSIDAPVVDHSPALDGVDFGPSVHGSREVSPFDMAPMPLDVTAPFPSVAAPPAPPVRPAARERRAQTLPPVPDHDGLDFVVSPRSAYDGVVVTLPDPNTGWHHIMYISANLAATLGYEPEHLLGRTMVVLFGDDPPRAQLELIEERLADGLQVEAAHVLRHRSGNAVAVHATHTPLPAVHPSSRYRLILFRDLTRRATDEMLAEQEQVLASLARGQDLGSLCHDVAAQAASEMGGEAQCWIGLANGNDRLETVITGGQEAELVGSVMRLVMGTGDPTSARCVLVEHLPAELADSLRANDVLALWAFPALDRHNQQRGALVVAHTSHEMPTQDEVRLLDHLATTIAEGIERAAVEAGLAQRALHDPLTRLPNRVLIVDRLEQAMARLDRDPSSLAVLLVDIDRFRAVNDAWGPEVGDRVLTEVAGRLLNVVRLGDTVGRISSDQFLMICTATTDFDPSVVARRAIRSLQEPIRLADGNELRITASVGVVVVGEPAMSPTAVISNAESALASAVEGGRGRFALYDPGRQRRDQIRHGFEQALSAAVAGGELVVYYQPVCEVRTGRMIGAEALVRWNRPGHGLVGPAEFIEVAEETGLIVPLGAWVIDEVARHLAAWPRSTVPGAAATPVISVNLSARQLADETLVARVVDALRRHDLSPVNLGFEVTESNRIDDPAAAAGTLRALSSLGCRIAVDDFGIGYATLDYLRHFSMADIIKIDRSFVAGLGQSKEDTAIVNASLALASSLKMRVVAEGVENFGQLSLLDEMGCHYAQGYALSPPVPVETAIALWKTRQLYLPTDAEPIALGPIGGLLG
jgi:diguanylate cyclase (GGDEF)-like protein/PAS domain S-box-containing protein